MLKQLWLVSIAIQWVIVLYFTLHSSAMLGLLLLLLAITCNAIIAFFYWWFTDNV